MAYILGMVFMVAIAGIAAEHYRRVGRMGAPSDDTRRAGDEPPRGMRDHTGSTGLNF